MTYKLAKQLKEAGFRQGVFNERDFICEHGEQPKQECGTEAYAPTLEELIEACGNVNMTLLQCGDHWDIKWFEGYEERDTTNSKTPTEAVANLWLALNKK